MTDVDPHATRRDLVPNIPAELLEAGFDNVEEIGRGGFGVVYRCVQPSLDRAVAVKVLSTDLDRDNLERFLREQRAMGRLSGHPHIVTVLQVGVLAGGRPFIVMPYHAKNSLETLIRRHGPLDWRETLSIGVKLAGALEAAHRVGTLHRDVKPGNILLTDYGEPQLTDFGIARIAGGFETATGVIAGSPAFTAPEVLEGASPTPASDVYSLGATLFCALTGHAAYERRSGERVIAQFLRITSQPIPDLRKQGLPADVAAAIERAMARHPADRPALDVGAGRRRCGVALAAPRLRFAHLGLGFRFAHLGVQDIHPEIGVVLDRIRTHVFGTGRRPRGCSVAMRVAQWPRVSLSSGPDSRRSCGGDLGQRGSGCDQYTVLVGSSATCSATGSAGDCGAASPTWTRPLAAGDWLACASGPAW